ncbi:hypothetical protein EYE35_20515 [Cereibacter sphaeroides]|nr:hypothetical protein EYE35_20515 [Cereibacter sphaeroides]RAZ84504.1 hypothetical protein DDV93_12180 [Cereibacter johrii]
MPSEGLSGLPMQTPRSAEGRHAGARPDAPATAPHPMVPQPPDHWLTEAEVPPALRVAEALVAYLAQGLARYRALVTLASTAPQVPPPDRMLITIAPAGPRELRLVLFLPGQDSLRLDLIDLGIYRLLGSGLPMEGGGLRLIPIPAFSRLQAEGAVLRKDVVYRIAPLDALPDDNEAMGG